MLAWSMQLVMVFPQEIAWTGIHRHYSVAHVRTLPESAFGVQYISYTGLGPVELVNLPLLIACRYILGWEWLYQILQYVYFLVDLLKDLLPLGPPGYHGMLVATKEQAFPVGK
jgi:hypothetical protein